MGAPTALHLVCRRHLASLDEVAQSRLESGQEAIEATSLVLREDSDVETGLAPHRADIDDVVGVITHLLGHGVFQGVHDRHVQMVMIGLAEAHVVLGDHVTLGQSLDIGNAHERRGHVTVVEVEALDVHPGSHCSVPSRPGAAN